MLDNSPLVPGYFLELFGFFDNIFLTLCVEFEEAMDTSSMFNPSKYREILSTGSDQEDMKK